MRKPWKRGCVPVLAALALLACGPAGDTCDEDLSCSAPGARACRSETLRFGTCKRLLKTCTPNMFDESIYLWLPSKFLCRQDSECTSLMAETRCELPPGSTLFGYCVCP